MANPRAPHRASFCAVTGRALDALSIEAATPDEARAILQLKGRGAVRF